MFTGIVQGIARIAQIEDRTGLRSFTLQLPAGFDEGLALGASVAVDGVCLTVTARPTPGQACFDPLSVEPTGTVTEYQSSSRRLVTRPV